MRDGHMTAEERLPEPPELNATAMQRVWDADFYGAPIGMVPRDKELALTAVLAYLVASARLGVVRAGAVAAPRAEPSPAAIQAAIDAYAGEQNLDAPRAWREVMREVLRAAYAVDLGEPAPLREPPESLEAIVQWLDSFDWWNESTKGIAQAILKRFGSAALRAPGTTLIPHRVCPKCSKPLGLDRDYFCMGHGKEPAPRLGGVEVLMQAKVAPALEAAARELPAGAPDALRASGLDVEAIKWAVALLEIHDGVKVNENSQYWLTRLRAMVPVTGAGL